MVVTGPLDTTCIAYTNLLTLFEYQYIKVWHVQTKITQQIISTKTMSVCLSQISIISGQHKVGIKKNKNKKNRRTT